MELIGKTIIKSFQITESDAVQHDAAGGDTDKNKDGEPDEKKEPERESREYRGVVKSYENPYYRVVYEDGDEEEMSAGEVILNQCRI